MKKMTTNKMHGAILALAAAAAMAFAPAAQSATKGVWKPTPYVGYGKTTNLAKAAAKAKAAGELSKGECRGVHLNYQVTRLNARYMRASLTFICGEIDLWQ